MARKVEENGPFDQSSACHCKSIRHRDGGDDRAGICPHVNRMDPGGRGDDRDRARGRRP